MPKTCMLSNLDHTPLYFYIDLHLVGHFWLPIPVDGVQQYNRYHKYSEHVSQQNLVIHIVTKNKMYKSKIHVQYVIN